MKRQSLVLLAVAFVAAGAAGCFKDPVKPITGGPSAFTVDHSAVTVRSGDSTTVTAYLVDAAGNQREVTGATWTSTNPAIAAVRIDTSKAIPGSAYTKAVIRGVDSVSGGWTNVIVTSRSVADTIRVLVIPAGFTMSHVAFAGPTLTDTVEIPANAVSGTPTQYVAYSGPDTLILNGTSLLTFDTSKVAVSVSTTNGASKGFIVSKTPSQLKVLFQVGTAGRVMVQHLLLAPGNAKIGTVVVDTLIGDSIAVAPWRIGGSTFGGGIVQTGDTLTITAGAGQSYDATTTAAIGGAPAYILSQTATTLRVLSTQQDLSADSKAAVTVYNVGLVASGTGVASVMLDSIAAHRLPAYVVHPPTVNVAVAGDTMTITARPGMAFLPATVVFFNAPNGTQIGQGAIFVRSASQLKLLSPATFDSGFVEVDTTTIESVAIPTVLTPATYAMNAAYFPGASVSVGAGKLGDTVTITAPAGVTFSTTGAVSKVLLGNRAVATSDTAWVLSLSGSSIKAFAKRGGKGTVSVTNLQAGGGLIPILSTQAQVAIDSVASDFSPAATLATARLTVVPVSNVDTVYGRVYCQDSDGSGNCYFNGSAVFDYTTFVTAVSDTIGINVAWFGSGNPYGTGSNTVVNTADLDAVLCDNTMACDESDASDLTGYKAASTKQPESGTSKTIEPAAQYWVGVIPFTGPFSVVYRLIITLKP